MKKIFLFLASIAIVLGLFLSFRNQYHNEDDVDVKQEESGDAYIHELNIPMMEVDSLNPLASKNSQVQNVLSLIYEPLVTINKNEELESCLATEWAMKDETSYLIKLRNDVLWHSGNEFTAEDVIFTFQLLINKTIDSVYYDNVKNIRSIEKLDQYSLKVSLEEPDAFFMYKMMIPIVPEYYFKNGDIKNEYKVNRPVGTGPYKYVNASSTVLEMIRNVNWWKKSEEIRLENIYLYLYDSYGEAIKAYKSSDVDLIFTNMPNWEKKFGTIGNNIYRFESSIYNLLIPNTNVKGLKDASVRKAILYALNREIIVSEAFHSNANIANLPMHSYSRFYQNDCISNQDIEKAKQILLNDSWQLTNGVWTKESVTLKFTLLINQENAEQVIAGDMIKESLEEFGFKITLKKLKWNEYSSALKNGQFDLALASIDMKNETTLIDMVETKGKANYANYSSEKMDAIISQLKTENSDIIKKEFYNFYKDELPYVGLYFRDNTLLTNKSVKGSIEPLWSNFYYGITSWCK